MIVARGMGRGAAGAIVAFGLGLSVLSPIIPPVEPPSGGFSISASQRRLVNFDDRDLLEIIPIVMGAINVRH